MATGGDREGSLLDAEFDRIDVNKDGVLTRDEFVRASTGASTGAARGSSMITQEPIDEHQQWQVVSLGIASADIDCRPRTGRKRSLQERRRDAGVLPGN